MSLCRFCGASQADANDQQYGAVCQQCGLIKASIVSGSISDDGFLVPSDDTSSSSYVSNTISSSSRRRLIDHLSLYLSQLHLSVGSLLPACSSLLDRFLNYRYGNGTARWFDLVCISIIYIIHRKYRPHNVLVIAEVANMINMPKTACVKMIRRIEEETQINSPNYRTSHDSTDNSALRDSNNSSTNNGNDIRRTHSQSPSDYLDPLLGVIQTDVQTREIIRANVIDLLFIADTQWAKMEGATRLSSTIYANVYLLI